jgi:glycosyltransferase involved in cell wall biosynthesis
MKVTFFSAPVLEHGGGAEQYLIHAASWLAKHNNDMDIQVVTLSDRLFHRLTRMLSFYYFRNLNSDKQYREKSDDVIRRMRPAKYIKCDSIQQLKQLLHGADVIYARNELIDLFFIKLIGYKNLPPVVVAIHTPIHYPHVTTHYEWLHNFLYMGPIYSELLRGASTIKVANKDDKALVERRFRNKRVALIRHSIALAQPKVALQRKYFQVLFLGRLVKQKGAGIFAECIAMFSEMPEFATMKFVIAGDGDKDLITKMNELADKYVNVSYLGHVEKEKVGVLFENSDLVLIPSLYETVNQVALEAGAYGTIVVASDIPGPREVIENQVTGYLIEPTVTAFFSKTLELMQLKNDDPAKFSKLGTAAQERIKQNFDPENEYIALANMIRAEVI